MIKVYSTPTCPKCRVLHMKLDKKLIAYEDIQDIDLMSSLGIKSAPAIEVDGRLIKDFAEINKWVNDQEDNTVAS